jgi:hypothetical protein
MPKKPFVKPMIIDLSLEGMTGIGADSCNDGSAVDGGSCASFGTAAGIACSDGYSFSGNCGNGFDPNSIPGSFCSTGSSATSACAPGSSAITNKASCYDGSSASYVYCSPGAVYSVCGGGSTHSICFNGVGQPGHASS